VIADGGVGAVIDPKWDIADYLRLAQEEEFRIDYVLETHTHADHVSGRGRLVAATGATVFVSPTSDLAYPHAVLRDGETVEFGSVRIISLATPGHRPEHTAYLVEDTRRANAPWIALTGDSLFVADVARPDLATDAEIGARSLYRSLKRLLELDDGVGIFPGHVGGSLCGSSRMSQAPTSTIGFERQFNELLQLASEQEFVSTLTASLSPKPPNFHRIVDLNRGPSLATDSSYEALYPEQVQELLAGGAIALDGREPRDFMAQHLPSSINISLIAGSVGTRAAWAVDPAVEIVTVGYDDDRGAHMASLLEAVGFSSVRGFLAGGFRTWRASGRATRSIPSVGVDVLAELLKSRSVDVIDVRDLDEWDAGHIDGSLHIPYQGLNAEDHGTISLQRGRPLAVVCSAGNRSALAVSLLARHADNGNLMHIGAGGVADLTGHGVSLVRSG
jgi:hydroxyacylglutathione hydrolase